MEPACSTLLLAFLGNCRFDWWFAIVNTVVVITLYLIGSFQGDREEDAEEL